VSMAAAVEDRVGPAERWTQPGARDFDTVNRLVTAPLLERGSWRWTAWWIGFAASLALTLTMLVAIVWLFVRRAS
jgi:hypothetical protein